jgi:hypothetical protein
MGNDRSGSGVQCAIFVGEISPRAGAAEASSNIPANCSMAMPPAGRFGVAMSYYIVWLYYFDLCWEDSITIIRMVFRTAAILPDSNRIETIMPPIEKQKITNSSPL